MKDFRVIAKVVNNQMRERREALGITQAEAARRAGIGAMTYNNLENLKDSPLDGRRCRLGKWIPSAIRIAHMFGVEPEVLWPAEVRAVRARMVERRANAEELHALACPPPDQSPFGILAAGEEAAAVHAAIDALPDVQRSVLRARFGLDGEPKHLGEIGDELGVSRERARQIECVALERVRRAVGAA